MPIVLLAVEGRSGGWPVRSLQLSEGFLKRRLPVTYIGGVHAYLSVGESMNVYGQEHSIPRSCPAKSPLRTCLALVCRCGR